MTYNVELVLDIQAALGEGPHWDEQVGVLYWIDIQGKKLHAYDPSNGENRTIQFDQMIGAAVPSEDDKFILAMENGIYEYDMKKDDLTLIINPEADLENNRFNDAKCDPSGRLWAGTMAMNGQLGQGNLYRLDQNKELTKMVSDVSISNGLAWSPDHKYMYYIDTPTSEVVAYDYDDETGNISNKKTVIKFTSEMGSPDGMTIDREGMLWIAHWGGSRVSRWNPQNGELLEEIKVPAQNVTSCAFGGKDLDELYITTARVGTSEEQLERFPHAGGLFKVKTKVQGMVGQRFG